MKAIIMAGGKGTRLSPYTKILPKPLMPIGDMPILEVLLRQIKSSGIHDVVLAVGHLSELLRAFFNNGHRLGMNIDYSYEDQPLGTAGPLVQIKGLDETFLVANGDILTTLNIRDLIDFHHQQKAIATIAVHQRQVKIDLGVIHWNDAPLIKNYEEKPSFDFMVSMGISIFEPTVLDYIAPNERLDFPDLILRLIEDDQKVAGYHFEGYWQDLGRADDYDTATNDFEKNRSQFLNDGGAL